MPKVKINNAQGLVQETGGGIALFGATQSITANATAANAAILSTTSLVLGDSGNNSHKIQLPAIGGLDTGHTVIVANVDSAQDFVLVPAANGTRFNGVASTPVSVTLAEKTVVKCVYSGKANPGWIVVVGDQATVPA